MFENEKNYSFLRDMVEKLSSGVLDQRATSVISFRKTQVHAFRQDSKEKQYEDRNGLTKLPVEQFIIRTWSKSSRQILKCHLNDVLSTDQESHLTWLAKKLLRSKSYRVSHAFVRSDLFLTQHRARTGSLHKDLLDDYYHVVNAAYCDIYGTSESGQRQYVPSVLPEVKFALYDHSQSVIEWLYTLSES